MIVVYGRRSYGRVDAHGGEHARSSFAHIYWMPVFPLSSFWVTQEYADSSRGFSIPMSGKSVAAAYLRAWGPVAAIGALAAGGAGGAIAGLMFASASVWSWTWRSVRGANAHKKSDFRRLAYGTRCDPKRMPEELRASVKRGLDARWERLGLGYSPDDVAVQGAKSPVEAVVAYGLLELAAVDAPPHARAKAAEAAKRILEGSHDTLPAIDGPYRDALSDAGAMLSDEDYARAAQTVGAPPAPRPAPSAEPKSPGQVLRDIANNR